MRKLLSREDLLPEHMQIFVRGEEERYQFRGKKLLTVALDVIASHLLCKYESLTGVEELIVVSKGKKGDIWIQNQGRVNGEAVRQLFGRDLETGKPIIAAEEIKVYNPSRKENPRLPVAVIDQRHKGIPTLIALECSPEEAVALIGELVAIHLISDKGFIRLTTVLNEFQPTRTTTKKSPR